MPKYKTYTAEQYKKGNPKFNLLLNERRLLIKALIKSEWKMEEAYKLNFPVPTITIDAYNWILLRHHINVGKKAFKKISEIE